MRASMIAVPSGLFESRLNEFCKEGIFNLHVGFASPPSAQGMPEKFLIRSQGTLHQGVIGSRLVVGNFTTLTASDSVVSFTLAPRVVCQAPNLPLL